MKKEKVNYKDPHVIALLGIFSALVAVLQLISYFIKIGQFPLTLVLIPVVLGAVLYGPDFGAILGAVFGAVTVIGCITGIDLGGNALFSASPILTIITCMAKATAAGYVPGLIATSLKKKHLHLAVILAAVSAPVVNTGLFIMAMFTFFKDTLFVWSGDNNVFFYALITLIGFNFLFEFLLNAILAPVVYRVVRVIEKRFNKRIF
ncbi:MAG: ECF transporter S component [Clostridia bacterium]|nr:ECF transporter S component [Clostridia bacterium]